jgi:ribosomal protein S6--L-glutamate ligase
MEVNSSPGFEGLEAASRVDIARLYVQHAVDFADARLSRVSPGHLA